MPDESPKLKASLSKELQASLQKLNYHRQRIEKMKKAKSQLKKFMTILSEKSARIEPEDLKQQNKPNRN